VITHSDGSVEWEPGSNRALVRVSGKPSTQSPAHFGEADPAPPASEPDTEEPHESETSTTAEDDSCSESPMSESLFAELSSADPPEEAAAKRPAPMSFSLSAGAHRLSKPHGHCEDSYFFGERVLGVADGVGEMIRFADLGVDAAVYAAELMEIAASYLQGEVGAATLEAKGPKAATAAALAEAETKAASYGASTAAVLAISADGSTAGVANLGDSGFIHLRRSAWGAMEIAERSREQEHSFNCPYQFCRVPEELARRLVYRDTVALCNEYELALQPGDLILMYTDGLTDNLHGYEIASMVNTALESSGGKVAPQSLAETLARAAHERSLDPAADTPFFRAARRHRQHMPGGKADDITVVAAWVEPDEGHDGPSGSGDVRLGRPHQAEAQSTLPGKRMERKATQSLLPDAEPGEDTMQRKATQSLLPDVGPALEEVEPRGEDGRCQLEREATQMLPVEQ
jgi:protein phosphatase PTC7